MLNRSLRATLGALTFLLFAIPGFGLATTLSVPNSFHNGEYPDAGLFNANNSAIVTWANGGIDNTNIGSAGLFASQILPQNAAQATFGGVQPYTFPSGMIAGTSASTYFNFGDSAAGFSATQPYLGNASDGGMNFSIPVTSTLAYRFFTGNGGPSACEAAINGGGVAAGCGNVLAAGDLQTARTANTGAIEFGSTPATTGVEDWDGTNYFWTNAGYGSNVMSLNTQNDTLTTGTGAFNNPAYSLTLGGNNTNGSVNTIGSSALLLQYSEGTGGVDFGNGASGVVGHIDGGGNLGLNGSATINGSESVLTNFAVNGSASVGTYLNAASYLQHAGTNTYPYDAASNNGNSHIERGAIPVGGSGGNYTIHFIVSYTSATSYTCVVSPAAYGGGGTPSTGILYTNAYAANSFAIINGINAEVNVNYVCVGY